jgi:membrane peptidoglycan carboxypeptidase
MPFPSPHPMPQATLIMDDRGHVLTTFSVENRVDVKLAQVPPIVVDAVVSTEDRRFFSEGALDPSGIARAVVNDVRHPSGLQGGSTITQQYVKVAYLNSKRTFFRKIEESVLALRLSEQKSKHQILQGYLNAIYWGRGAYGVEAASRAYFGKDVGQLGLPEASLLASLIRDPSAADPAVDPFLAKKGQMETLKALVRDHKVTKQQADAAAAVPFSQFVTPVGTPNGHALDPSGEDYFLTAVRQQLYAKYGRRMVDSGGLKVTTTLDETLQKDAYQSIYGSSSTSLNPAKSGPSGALVSIDDAGLVRAFVGGQNYQTSAVDLALGRLGGGSGRQAGSTFKAFMLAEVIHEGYTVDSVLPAPPTYTVQNGTSGGAPWQVTNYEHESVAPQMSLVDATALSVNTVYAQVVQRIGADKLDAMAEQLGISPKEIPQPFPSQVLGTVEVSPLEMADAYSTFAADGVQHTPILITKVTKADGTNLALPVTPHQHQVLTSQQAAVETYVLQQVVAKGTGVAAGGVGSPIAGKTGTTEHSSDAWFIGYTPKLTTAVWMGYPDGNKSMDGFRGLGSVTGGTIPASLWHDYMAAALTDEPAYIGSFPSPGPLTGKPLLLTTTNPHPGPTATFGTLGSTTTTSSSTTTTTTPNQPGQGNGNGNGKGSNTTQPPPTTVPQTTPSTTAANPSTTSTTTPSTTTTTAPP